MQSPPPVSKKGNLFKTGSDRSGWKRRYCSLDKFRGFEYFKAEGVNYIYLIVILHV